MQQNKVIRLDALISFASEVLQRHGMSKEDALVTAKILANTDAFGINSHGTKNLKGYIDKMNCKALFADAKPELVREGPSFAVYDAHDCVGMVAGHTGMQKAIEIAKKTGIGYVAVKNSCHFGAGFSYVRDAAEEGLFGIAMSNTDPNMAVPGGKTMVIGNNPLAFGIPVKNRKPVVLDVALSATAALKINKAKTYGQKIPTNWLLDPEGNPTDDPNWYQNGGALQPMAAHKGYGFSMMVEALTSIAAGGLLVRDVKSWCFDLENKNRVSHGFIAIDLDAVCGGDAEQAALDYVEYIKNSPKAASTDRLLVPGELEWEKCDKAVKDGLELPYDVVDVLEALSKQENLPLKWL